MSHFIDGPAKGVSLQVRRAPIVLRVTQSSDGVWDALDQPDDEPRTDEAVYVYLLVSGISRCHIRATSKRASGFFESGHYRLLDPQPNDSEIRKTSDWKLWCEKNETWIRNLHKSAVHQNE